MLPALDGFEVEYVTEDGADTPDRVDRRMAGAVRVGRASAAVAVTPRQWHLPGRWWSATDGGHVGYASWLERDHVMLLDFDPTVVAIVSQPFWLSWAAADGRSRSQAPYDFARRADGSAVVVVCQPVDRRDGPRDVAAFEATLRRRPTARPSLSGGPSPCVRRPVAGAWSLIAVTSAAVG